MRALINSELAGPVLGCIDADFGNHRIKISVLHLFQALQSHLLTFSLSQFSSFSLSRRSRSLQLPCLVIVSCATTGLPAVTRLSARLRAPGRCCSFLAVLSSTTGGKFRCAAQSPAWKAAGRYCQTRSTQMHAQLFSSAAICPHGCAQAARDPPETLVRFKFRSWNVKDPQGLRGSLSAG